MVVAEAPREPRERPAERPEPPRRESFRTNAAAMATGQAATWSLALITFAILPRYLGPHGMGQVSVGLAVATLGGVVGRAGVNVLIAREVARDRERAAQLLPTMMWLGLSVGTTAALVSTAAAWALGYDRDTLGVIALFSATIPVGILMLLGFATAQGLERMRYQAIADVAGKSTLLLGVVISLATIGTASGVAVAHIAAAAIAAGVAGLLVHRVFPLHLTHFSMPDARYLAKASLPFVAIELITAAYIASDAILLSRLATESDAGIYGTPARLVSALVALPFIVGAVTFPRMAAEFGSNAASRFRLPRLTLRVIAGITMPLSIVLIGVGPDLLIWLIGEEFEQSRAVFVALLIARVPTSFNIVIGNILMAADRERWWTRVRVVVLVIKLTLNVGLIALFDAWFGNPALGVATALVVTELITTLIVLTSLPMAVFDRDSLRHLAKIATAGVLAGSAMLVVATSVSDLFGLAAVVGLATYVAFAALLRTYSRAEMRDLFQWARTFRSARRDATRG